MLKYSPDPVLREIEAESIRRDGIWTPEKRGQFNQMRDEGKAAG